MRLLQPCRPSAPGCSPTATCSTCSSWVDRWACSSPLAGRSTARGSSRRTPIRNRDRPRRTARPDIAGGTTRPVGPCQARRGAGRRAMPGAIDAALAASWDFALGDAAIPAVRDEASLRAAAARARQALEARLGEGRRGPCARRRAGQAHSACAGAARARLRGAPPVRCARRRGARRVARRPGTRGRGSAGRRDLADAPGAGSRTADASGHRAARGGGDGRHAAGPQPCAGPASSRCGLERAAGTGLRRWRRVAGAVGRRGARTRSARLRGCSSTSSPRSCRRRPKAPASRSATSRRPRWHRRRCCSRCRR